MRRPGRIALVAAGAVAVAVGVALAAALLHRRRAPQTRAPEPLPAPAPVAPPRVSAEDFAGADACAGCHAREYAAWRGSTHGRAGGPPTLDRVLAHFDGRPIRFRDAVVIPTVEQGEFRFQVRVDGEPERVLRADGAVGGGHMVGGGTQGFVMRMDDGTLRFLPFDYSRAVGRWFCNTEGRGGAGWVPITDTLSIAACSDWPPTRVLGPLARFSNCQQCHGSQITVRWSAAARAYDTHVGSLSVDCESCHGPAARHVALMRSGASGPDIGLRSLRVLDKDASLSVCFRCHALKDALANGYLPGERLERYFALKFPMLGDRPYQADGRVRSFAYQGTHLYSDCYLNGSMTCVDCHDPHTQGYRDNFGRPVADRLGDGQCLGCHPSKQPVERHTHHAAGSAGSRCTACHMPYLQQPEVGHAVPYARSDHTIPIPRPGSDDSLGVTNACSLCHRDRTVAQLAAETRSLWGTLKPRRAEVEGLLRADTVRDAGRAARLLLHPDARFAMAQFAGLAAFAERFARPDASAPDAAATARLEALARDSDLDVRALALAELHLVVGDRPAVRGRLAAALREAGPDDRPLRLRWTAALAYLGDRFSELGRADDAEAAYRKALEVLPGDPRLWGNLGLVQARAGRSEQAVESYRSSLAADSLQPLTLVNLGNALEALGRAGDAAQAYLAAARMDPWEPVAFFNLANARLRAGDPEHAVPLYRRALELDGSLAPAAFYLGRSLILLGRYREALDAVRTGLRFRPHDATGLQMQRDLRRAVALDTLAAPR